MGRDEFKVVLELGQRHQSGGMAEATVRHAEGHTALFGPIAAVNT